MGFFTELLEFLFEPKKQTKNIEVPKQEPNILETKQKEIEETKQEKNIIETKQKEIEKPKQEQIIIETQQEELKEPTEEINTKSENFPYILTNCIFNNKENKFYISLKRIADKCNLVVFTKTRIADLVYIPKNHNQYMRWFNYIKAKHVDFIICDINLKPVLIIEVDDSSHDREKRIQRDKFVDEIFRQVNLPILHIRLWKDEELEKQIKEVLKIA